MYIYIYFRFIILFNFTFLMLCIDSHKHLRVNAILVQLALVENETFVRRKMIDDRQKYRNAINKHKNGGFNSNGISSPRGASPLDLTHR